MKPISNLKSLIIHSIFVRCSSVIVTLLLLCAIAIAPVLRAEAPCTHDGGLHYYRVVAMRQALRDGILFTRYLPDLAFGYGFPFFNYREPTSYCLALALHLVGLPLPVALNLVYVSSIAGSALAAYLLARDLFGPQAGLVAAVAYAYAPYQLLDALIRGNAPESLALPLMPLILWAFRRLALTGARHWFLLSVGSLATLYLTHNISSLLFTPLLVAYLFVLWLVHRREGHWMAAGGALALALCLTAFFWGPAILEKGYVHLERSRSNRNNDFHYNFLGLAEIFAPPQPVDTSLLNPPTQIPLGLVPAVLAGIGLMVGLFPSAGSGQSHWRDRERRATLLFLALAAAVMIGMSTGASVWLWEHLPLISFVQFPWRFVGRAALPIALLASAIAPDTSSTTRYPSRFMHHVSRFTPLLLIPILILAAFPHAYPLQGYCPSAPYPTIADLFAYEHRPGGLVGADPTGSYFPIWVRQRPTGSPLEEQYAAGVPVTRFDEAALPGGATVVEADYGPNRARVVLDTPTAFRARYLAFYFPGWRVTVDGEPAEIAPTEPEGLIAFDVPAGRHAVAVRFGETPLRLAADTISLFALIALIVLAARLSNPQSPISESTPNDSPSFIVHCSLCILAIILLAFKLAVVDRTETPFRHPILRPDGTLPGVEHPLNRRYADGLTLIGYDQDRETMPADGVLRVDLYLTAYAQPAARYQSVVHLVGPDRQRWSTPDTFRPRGYADYPYTTIWSPGVYALDSHEIEPLPGTPPGTYDIVLTIFDKDTLAPLSVLNEQGQPAAPRLTLGQVTLTRPRRPAQLSDNSLLKLPLGSFTLLTADFDRTQAAPGDPVLCITYWRADAQPTEDVKFHLTLVAPDGARAAKYDLPLATAWYPTSAWQPGDVWRGQHILRLPAGLGDDDYTWTIRLSGTSAHTLARLSISAPPHTFTSPPVNLAVDARLGDVATLVGANLEPETGDLEPGTTLTVTLVWRAEDTPTISYHVFLHLLDPGGRLIAQSDSIPASWGRPTIGWLPGEVIADTHTLVIPADAPTGDYTLLAGLYDPDTSARLADPTGADAIPLTTITVRGP